MDWEPTPIYLTGDGIKMTLKDVQPYLEFHRGDVEALEDEMAVQEDITGILELCRILNY